ncbi:MAG: PEP-CTERM sorting domain-containing protein [Hydrogenophilaceae bacterium]
MNLAHFPARLFCTILATLSGQADASVIDFNSLATTTTNPFVTVAQPYVEDGFSLTTRSGVSFTYGGGTIYATTDKNANWTGSPGVYSGVVTGYGSAFLLEGVDGGTFDLVSMDAASFYTGGAGNYFSVYGYPAAGGYVNQNFTLDSSTNTLQTLIFNDSFKGLEKIIFSSVYAQIDNINLHVSAVPLPPSIAMILPGLGLLGYVARRRRTTA